MRTEMRKETRGSTLVELMVAIVILAIVVMFVAMVPTQSQQLMLRADRVSAASAAARDKMEHFRSVIGRTGVAGYRGFTVLMNLYPNGAVWYTDTFQFSEIKVLRQWQFKWPGVGAADSGIGRLDLRCVPMANGAWTADSVWINTLVAKRDTLPPL